MVLNFELRIVKLKRSETTKELNTTMKNRVNAVEIKYVGMNFLQKMQDIHLLA